MWCDRALPDVTEQGIEFIELHLGDLHVKQDIVGKALELGSSLNQPGQDGSGFDLEEPGNGTDAKPFRESANGPDQHLRADVRAMKE